MIGVRGFISSSRGLLTRKNARQVFLASSQGHHVDSQSKGRAHEHNENKRSLLAATAAAVGGVSLWWAWQHKDELMVPVQAKSNLLRTYSAEEVSRHDTLAKGVWVSYGDGVYDITDFIPKHPGSRQIMMAAGGPIEPFWETYAVHKNNKQVMDMLQEYRIGNLQAKDVINSKQADLSKDNPFSNEPIRHPLLKRVSTTPFNAETPLATLGKEFYTPNEFFYVRNHLPTPDVSEEDFELEIEGVDKRSAKKKTLNLSLKDIKTNFPKYTVVATIQCGGNRRAEMNAVRPLKGLNWEGGAIGNASWTGARLSDVLKAAGVAEDSTVQHVQFEGSDVGPDGSPYGASIPIEKALNPESDVLLAYEMNSTPLPRDHGFPLRVVVPGVVGARHVKWLNRIVVSEAESPAHWQQNDYKGFNPSIDWDTVDFSRSPAIQNLPVTSAICDGAVSRDSDGTTMIDISGYAWSGGGNKIIRVDLTADKGKTWTEAELTCQQDRAEAKDGRHYGWTLWSAMVRVPSSSSSSTVEVWSKAVDSSYNVQPEKFEHIWNLRGLLSNAYCKRKFDVTGAKK